MKNENVIYDAAMRRVAQRIIDKGEIPKGKHAAVVQYIELYGLPMFEGKHRKYVTKEYKNPQSLIYKDTTFVKRPPKAKKIRAAKNAEKRMNYEQYMKSVEWKNLRMSIYAKRGRKCEKCGQDKGEIHAHHLTYERFTKELEEDIMLLCRPCHEKEHGRKFNNSAKPKKDKRPKRPKRKQDKGFPETEIQKRYKAMQIYPMHKKIDILK